MNENPSEILNIYNDTNSNDNTVSGDDKNIFVQNLITLMEQGEETEAIKYCNQFLTHPTLSVDALLIKFDILIHLERENEALECLQEFLLHNPNWETWGRLLQTSKNFLEVIPCYIKALQIILSDLAQKEEKNGNSAEAKMYFRYAKPYELCIQGNAHYEQRNYLQALDCYEKATLLGFVFAAKIYQKLGRQDVANEFYKFAATVQFNASNDNKVTELQCEFINFLLEQSCLSTDIENNNDNSNSRLIEQFSDQNSPRPLRFKAEVLTLQGRLDETDGAFKCFDKILSLHPISESSRWIYNFKLNFTVKKLQSSYSTLADDALKANDQELIKSASDECAKWKSYEVGKLYYDEGNFSKALEIYRSVSDPKFFPCLLGAGQALQKLNNHEAANQYFKKATAIRLSDKKEWEKLVARDRNIVSNHFGSLYLEFIHLIEDFDKYNTLTESKMLSEPLQPNSPKVTTSLVVNVPTIDTNYQTIMDQLTVQSSTQKISTAKLAESEDVKALKQQDTEIAKVMLPSDEATTANSSSKTSNFFVPRKTETSPLLPSTINNKTEQTIPSRSCCVIV